MNQASRSILIGAFLALVLLAVAVDMSSRYVLQKSSSNEANRTVEAKNYLHDSVPTEVVSNNALYGIETGWEYSPRGEIISLSQVTPNTLGLLRQTKLPNEVLVFRGQNIILKGKVLSEVPVYHQRWMLYRKTSTFAVLSDASQGEIFSGESSWAWQNPRLAGYHMVGIGYCDQGTVALLKSPFSSNGGFDFQVMWLGDEIIESQVLELPTRPTDVAIVGQLIVAWSTDAENSVDSEGILTAYQIVSENSLFSFQPVWNLDCDLDLFQQVKEAVIAVTGSGYFQTTTRSTTGTVLLEFTPVAVQEPLLTSGWTLELPSIEKVVKLFTSPSGGQVIVVGKDGHQFVVDTIDTTRQERIQRLLMNPTGLLFEHLIQVGWVSETEFVVTWNDHISHDVGRPSH